MRVIILLAIFMMAVTAFGGSLSIRLVEASNVGGGIDSSLKDVTSALQGQLPFKTYRLVSSGSTALPAGNTKTSLSGYSVVCKGPQNALTITISHGRKKLASTMVNLRNGHPVLLGGFPSSGGKLLIVFVAH